MTLVLPAERKNEGQRRKTPSLKNEILISMGLAWQDLLDMYRGSALGPFWITLQTGLQVTVLAMVFGVLLDVDLGTYVPHVATGLVFWNFFTGSLNDSAFAYYKSVALVKQVNLGKAVPLARTLLKNVFVLVHQLPVILVLFLVLDLPLRAQVLLVFPGLAVLALNLSWVGGLLALLGARFRDVSPLLTSVLTFLFYGTPIIWTPDALPDSLRILLVDLNPASILLGLFRGTIQGNTVPWTIWVGASLSSILGLTIYRFALRKFGWQVVYWI